MDWNQSTALITGASSGIGAVTARMLAARGMHVILVARREERLLEVKNEIAQAGGKADVIQADLSVESERLCVYDEITAKCGCPDILINNAGFGWYGYFSSMPLDVCMNMIDIDIVATVHLTRLFLPEMLKKERARIISIGSIAGGLPEQGVAVYSACKSFVDSFSTALYRELKGTSTTASVIRCGPVKTEFFEHARGLPNGHSVPAERLAIPAEQVAEAVWKLIRHPRRVWYEPFYYVLSPILEIFFGRIIDRLGPVLLRKNVSKYPPSK